MPNYDRLSVVVSLILLCLALSLIIELPMRTFSFVVLGSPLTIRFSQNWPVAALLASMACIGTDSIVRLHPLSRGRKKLPCTFVFWILPGLATLLATLLLPRAPNRIYTLGSLAMMGILLPLIITAEYHTVDPAAPGYRAARLGLNVVAYLIALVLFVLVYGSSLIVGLVMGEIVWALNYSKVNSLTAGILLLLIFYLITGLSRQGLLGLLSRRILIEFALVALVGLVLLLKYVP